MTWRVRSEGMENSISIQARNEKETPKTREQNIGAKRMEYREDNTDCNEQEVLETKLTFSFLQFEKSVLFSFHDRIFPQ